MKKLIVLSMVLLAAVGCGTEMSNQAVQPENSSSQAPLSQQPGQPVFSQKTTNQPSRPLQKPTRLPPVQPLVNRAFVQEPRNAGAKPQVIFQQQVKAQQIKKPQLKSPQLKRYFSVMKNGQAMSVPKRREAEAFVRLPKKAAPKNGSFRLTSPNKLFSKKQLQSISQGTRVLAKNERRLLSQTAGEQKITGDYDQAVANLPTGNIAFNTPQKISLGETVIIELLLSPTETGQQLSMQINGRGPIQHATVKYAGEMEANLTGIGFNIEQITPQRQGVSGRYPTRWQWQIAPTSAKPLRLNLTLSAHVHVQGHDHVQTHVVETFSRFIEVEVSLASRITSFSKAHADWIFTALLFPVFGMLYRFFKGPKEKGLQASEEKDENLKTPRQAA